VEGRLGRSNRYGRYHLLIARARRITRSTVFVTLCFSLATLNGACGGKKSSPLSVATEVPSAFHASQIDVCDEYPEDSGTLTYQSAGIPENWVEGRFLVRIREGVGPNPTPQDQAQYLTRLLREQSGFTGATARPLSVPGAFELTIPSLTKPDAARAAIERMSALQGAPGHASSRRLFRSVEPVVLLWGAGPNDPKFLDGKQWGLTKINAPAAWPLLRLDDQPLTFAVVDSGLWFQPRPGSGTYDTGDLPQQARLWSDSQLAGPDTVLGHGFGASFIVTPKTGDPFDDAGHGTEIAGIAGATTNNSIGIAGTIGESTLFQLLVVKVLQKYAQTDKVSGTSTDIAEGTRFAAAHARVVNLSFGSDFPSSLMCQVMRDASDVLFVAAAGNEGEHSNSAFYPASYRLPNVISVMSTDGNDHVPDWSNTGNQSVDIAAPGDEIVSTGLNGTYREVSGTSFSAAFITGAAALVRSMNPSWTPAHVRAHLMDTAKKDSNFYNASQGRLDLAAALAAPVALSPSAFSPAWVASTSRQVHWTQPTHSRACSSVYVWLMPVGPIPTHDTCINAATCRVLASSVPVGDQNTTVVVPNDLSTSDARIRIGCDGSGLFSTSQPFTIQ
jgi:subtilisin family serine protease